MLALVTVACAGDDETPAASDGDAARHGGSPSATPTTPVTPRGFEVVTLRAVQPDGTVLEWCVWHAETAEQRGRGLMEVTDLGGPVGMVFTYDEPSRQSFFMYRTVLPLSIAWFDSAGGLVGAADMEPCEETNGRDCPLYTPARDYILAVEVPRGELDELGLTSGAQVEVAEGCRAGR